MYNTAEASTLKNIVNLKEEEQQKMEQELKQMKVNVEKEKNMIKNNMQEEIEDMKKKNKRDQEEYNNLKKQVDEFDKILTKRVEEEKKNTKDTTTKDLNNEFILKQKDFDTEKKVAEVTITNLEKTIQAQQEEIKSLKLHIDSLNKQLGQIAVSVVNSNKQTEKVQKEE